MRNRALILATILFGTRAAAQSPELERQLFAARDSVWRAWFANDTAVLHRLIPPALATLEAGRWSDRPTTMTGSRSFAKSGARLSHLRFTNNDISSWGSTAIVRSNYEYVTLGSGGKGDTSRGRAIELFVHDGTRWVNPYWQLVPNVPGEREIPLPDSLGTNFSGADSLQGRGSPTDYDKLIGLWEFRFQTRNADGSWNPPFPGHWSFEKKPGVNLIEDHWRPDDPSEPMAVTLYTYRVFDPEKKIWHMTGAHANGGELSLGATWADGSNLYGIQRSPSNVLRFRYYSMTADHFLWRADRSFDGGKTWHLDNALMEARRVGK